MFKKIPGNTDYRINLKGLVIDSHDRPVETQRQSLFFTLEMFGEKRTLLRRSLILLAWYEPQHIADLNSQLKNISFPPVDRRHLGVTCGHLMIFDEPIEYRPGFRHIPSFPRYAISIEGEILDTATNRIITERRDSQGYETIYIYNPDKGGNRDIRVHRLMALAWLPNKDFRTRPFVNHLDGVRSNNRLENLEWCSGQENVQHALDAGLNSTRTKMKSRDVLTGEIAIYRSLTEMVAKLGIGSIRNFDSTLPGYLLNRRYEIKRLDDDSPWFYEDKDEAPVDGDPIKAIYTITVLDKITGELSHFTNVKVFYKTYGIWTKSGTLRDGIAVLQEKCPHLDISHKRNSVIGPYRVIDLTDQSSSIFPSIAEVSSATGRTRSELQFDLSRRLKFIYDGRWIVVPHGVSFRKEDYVEKSKKFRGVSVRRISDGVEIRARSMKEAARLSGINFKTIVKYVDTGNSVKGYDIRALDS